MGSYYYYIFPLNLHNVTLCRQTDTIQPIKEGFTNKYPKIQMLAMSVIKLEQRRNFVS